MMATQDRSVELTPMQRRVAKIRIVGDSPLVVHAFSEKAKQAKAIRDPEADFNEARYRLEDGRDGFPATAFKQAAVNAARYVDGLTMTELWGAFHVCLGQELVAIDGPEPRMREDCVRVGGKGPGTGAADLRYRPEYFPWSVDLDIVYNERAVSVEQIINLFSIAGFAIGLGENRPQKKGQWGMFHVAAEGEV